MSGARPAPIRIATAGWAIPAAVASRFPKAGSGLQRYAARFNGVEINSTFYRSHRASTYARWRDSTPDDFKFAVKLPTAITHEARLVEAGPRLAAFTLEVAPLAPKLGPLLVQLPPNLAFEPQVAERFWEDLRAVWLGAVVCEPRHASWLEGPADELLRRHRIGRVAADPARVPEAGGPAGWPGVAYFRWHGSPRMYVSPYNKASLRDLAVRIRSLAPDTETWCVFDNTMSGAAAADALRLTQLLDGKDEVA